MTVLKEDLSWVKISVQDAGLIEPVELWDKGWPSHMTSHKLRTERTHILIYSRTERTNVPIY